MLDMRHKLTTYILKNPPDVNPAQAGTSKTERKMKRSQQKQHQNGDGDHEGDDMDLPVRMNFFDVLYGIDVLRGWYCAQLVQHLTELAVLAQSLSLRKNIKTILLI